ncbi:MAG: hypothetical protein ABSD53_08905 [Terriglobales bacterium]|jgi:hypothetical protein
MQALRPSSTKTKWRTRQAYCLDNGIVALTTLTGGGHIADFRLLDAAGSGVNVMWEAPWTSMDPDQFRSGHIRKYGPAPIGKFLAAFTGHAVCVDYFGAPSDAEIAQGLLLHGEAATSRWRLMEQKETAAEARLAFAVRLPAARLRFRRELRLLRGESVVYFDECIANEGTQDHFFHWTQHVTLGSPLLNPETSAIALSGTRAITWPHGYEGAALLPNNQEFTWPNAPTLDGGKVDLAQPFVRNGKGFIASLLLDPKREIGFVAALNWELGLLLGYCFRRADFPWVAIWEENMARLGSPWNGKVRARGLEFGSTPMPVGKEETFARGPLFDTPTFRRIPAKSSLRVPYVAFLCKVKSEWRSIGDIQLRADTIIVTEQQGHQLELRAVGLKKLSLDRPA